MCKQRCNVDAYPSIPLGTLVYSTKGDALALNGRAVIKKAVKGQNGWWVSALGHATECFMSSTGSWRYKPVAVAATAAAA